MPLIKVLQLSPHVRMGLWRMDEPFEDTTPRQRERMAVQHLLTAMTGDPTLTIDHEPSGRPILSSGLFLSISHTKGYAVLILSDEGPVGIDIEYRSDRVERIANRFIRPDEPAHTTDEKLLVWSAKETVYKLFSEDNLLFFDMRTLSIGERSLRMENLKRNIVVDVCYEFTDDYVLTYTF
jgi:4'-phosphopantetheinyl transferase EntD